MLRSTRRGIVFLALGLVPPAWAQRPWVLDPRPELDVAGEAPGRELRVESVAGAVRFSNGVLVMGERTGGMVRFLAPSGEVVRSVGGLGTRPGAFRSISWLGKCAADSVWVWDFTLQRMTVLDTAGRAVQIYRIPAEPARALPPALLSCSPQGAFRGHLAAEPDQTLWVVVSAPGDDRTRLQVFRDGRRVGEVVVPRAVDVFEVESDRLVGAYQDEAGQPHVAVYRLRHSVLMLRLPAAEREPPKPGCRIRGDSSDASRRPIRTPFWLATLTTLRGDVALPADSKVLEVETDHVLTRLTEASGEQRIVLYGVRRSAPAR